MKSTPRALRRHHVARRKARVLRENLYLVRDLPDGVRQRRVGFYAETPRVCSCMGCKGFAPGELSRSDRRAQAAVAHQLREAMAGEGGAR